MRLVLIGMCGALALAGCSSGKSGSNASDKGGGAITGGGQDQPTPSNLSDDPQNAMVPVTLPSPSPVSSIPVEFQGRWGMVVNDCDPGRADAKGLMVVTGSGLRFYESRASVDSLTMTGADMLTAQLAYSGEGRSWKAADRLTLLDDGKTLVRQEQSAPTSFRYSRCPAS